VNILKSISSMKVTKKIYSSKVVSGDWEKLWVKGKYSPKHVYHDRRDACPPVHGLSLVGRASHLSYLLKDCFRVSSLAANGVY